MFVWVWVRMHLCAHACEGHESLLMTHRNQKRAFDPLELELKVS